MGARPDHLDLSRVSLDPSLQPFLYLGELASPRIAGVPPVLSPLDAFALQGRLLQKKLEEQNAKGQRISRLPPLTVANGFARCPDFFRAVSGESAMSDQPEVKTEDTMPLSAQGRQHGARPQSYYPQILSSDTSLDQPSRFSTWEMWSRMQEQEQIVEEPEDYFAIPRTQPSGSAETKPSATVIAAVSAAHNSSDVPSGMDRTSTIGPTSSCDNAAGRLALPKSPVPGMPSWTTAGIRSVPNDSSDDVDVMSIGGSVDSTRKTSTSTSFSRSHSPCSSHQAPLPRSPSSTSDWSFNGFALTQPSLNFSRPLSRSSRPSCDSKHPFEGPFRQAAEESLKTPPLDRNLMSNPEYSPSTFPPVSFVHTPVSMASEEYIPSPDPNSNPVSSYIHTKYSLPRGRALTRGSANTQRASSQPPCGDGLMQPIDTIHTPRVSLTRPPSPVSMGESSGDSRLSTTESNPRQRISSAEGRGSPKQKPHHMSQLSSKSTTSDASTIKAGLARSKQLTAEVTPEQHLQKGIECHERGSLQESTYHLRIAAKAGNPTAMLLYALACRHGWGMRPNQADAVQWLQKAVELSQLEVDHDQGLLKQGTTKSGSIEQKTHKAQLALSIYELGVSYMNGWGVRQDRALALRCFEIAGNWGDADALAEAGFCYTEGLGCRKDLRKAARLYRMAEAKGISMTGNSWYVPLCGWIGRCALQVD